MSARSLSNSDSSARVEEHRDHDVESDHHHNDEQFHLHPPPVVVVPRMIHSIGATAAASISRPTLPSSPADAVGRRRGTLWSTAARAASLAGGRRRGR